MGESVPHFLRGLQMAVENENYSAGLVGACLRNLWPEIKAALGENEKLKAALKPFAEAAKHYQPYPTEPHNDCPVDPPGITLGHLRAAEAALTNG